MVCDYVVGLGLKSDDATAVGLDQGGIVAAQGNALDEEKR